MTTYLIYDKEGFILDDICAENYDDMLQQLEIVMRAGEIGVDDVRNGRVHMILNTELTELADHVEPELREDARQDICDDCTQSDPMRDYVFKTLLSALDEFVNDLPNNREECRMDTECNEDRRLDLAQDIKNVVDGYKDELDIENVKLEIKVRDEQI